MKPAPDFSSLCQSFFSKRLISQRRASQHTVSAYAQTFRLLAAYAQKRLGVAPSELSLAQLDAPFLAGFSDDLESSRSNSVRSRNARLASLRAFYHCTALEAPQHAGVIQRVSADAVQHALATHVAAARQKCPSLAKKRVTPHVLRHTAAMELLQAGVDRSLIAIWLGHESLDTTQVYLDADLHLKRIVLDKITPIHNRPGRFRPDDKLLSYLKEL